MHGSSSHAVRFPLKACRIGDMLLPSPPRSEVTHASEVVAASVLRRSAPSSKEPPRQPSPKSVASLRRQPVRNFHFCQHPARQPALPPHGRSLPCVRRRGACLDGAPSADPSSPPTQRSDGHVYVPRRAASRSCCRTLGALRVTNDTILSLRRGSVSSSASGSHAV